MDGTANIEETARFWCAEHPLEEGDTPILEGVLIGWQPLAPADALDIAGAAWFREASRTSSSASGSPAVRHAGICRHGHRRFARGRRDRRARGHMIGMAAGWFLALGRKG